MSAGIGGDANSPGQIVALYEEMQSARRAEVRPAAASPADLAFNAFVLTASRQAALASMSRVVPSDFIPQLDRLGARLDEASGLRDVLALGAREALIEACVVFASKYASGTADQDSRADFTAAVEAVKASTSPRQTEARVAP